MTAFDASALAAEGQLMAGPDVLIEGLNQPKTARVAGSPWAEELVERFRTARDNYCASYGVPLG